MSVEDPYPECLPTAIGIVLCGLSALLSVFLLSRLIEFIAG